MAHTVLFVDDDPHLLKGLRRSMREEPFRVLLAKDGAAALGVLDEHEIDVLVTDQEMPGLKGTMLLDLVRTRYPDVIRILLTGNANLDVALQAINKGEVFRLCTKPIDSRELAAVIRSALEQKDLLATSRDLLHTVRKQATVMERLERDNPGITKVDLDQEGRIVLSDDSLADLAIFLEDAKRELGRTKP
ncbi:MAG: response regulator [Candidatus Eisenbacteria bacterium]|nr:response regulator [Candidatus Eisenbacteria bacterium]